MKNKKNDQDSYHQNISEIFSLKRSLAARGFQVQSEGSIRETLLLKDSMAPQEKDLLFNIFNNPSSRWELLQFIEGVNSKIDSPEINKLINLPEFRKDRQGFSQTFEWYVGELLVRNFKAFSSSFSVKIKDISECINNGEIGDYDVLSVLGDMSILYLECKTGKCKQPSILNTIKRSISLYCVASVIFMGDRIDANALKQQIKTLSHPRFNAEDPLKLMSIKSLPESNIYNWFDCYFLPANEKSGVVESKMRTVLRMIAANRSSVFDSMKPDPDDYTKFGFKCIIIDT